MSQAAELLLKFIGVLHLPMLNRHPEFIRDLVAFFYPASKVPHGYADERIATQR